MYTNLTPYATTLTCLKTKTGTSLQQYHSKAWVGLKPHQPINVARIAINFKSPTKLKDFLRYAHSYMQGLKGAFFIWITIDPNKPIDYKQGVHRYVWLAYTQEAFAYNFLEPLSSTFVHTASSPESIEEDLKLPVGII